MNRLLGFSRRRWPAIALAVSLVLNGFLVGMMVADSLRPRPWRDGPRVVGFELRRLDRRLEPDALERVAAELRPLAPAFDQRFEELRAARDAIYRMAAEPNPDRQAIDQALATLRGEHQALQADVQRATYDALLKLPPEMRAGLAEPREKR